MVLCRRYQTFPSWSRNWRQPVDEDRIPYLYCLKLIHALFYFSKIINKKIFVWYGYIHTHADQVSVEAKNDPLLLKLDFILQILRSFDNPQMYFFSSEIRLISDVRGQTILIHVCRSITTLTTSINGGPRVSSNSSISIYSSYTSNLIVSFSCSIFIETLPVPPSWWRSNSCWIWCSCTLFLSSKKFSLQ